MRARIFATLLCLSAASTAFAEATVKEAWVRATVPTQKSTGAFMQIVSNIDARLVEIHSSLANVVEIHEMTMTDNIMRMRALPGLDLPAGKLIELKPNGYHLMLMELKTQIIEGTNVPLTIVIEYKDGKRESIHVNTAARALTGIPSIHR